MDASLHYLQGKAERLTRSALPAFRNQVDKNARARTVVVALGSNMGDRRAHLRGAIRQLRQLLADLRVSSMIETEPVGVEPQARFLNAVAVGSSQRDPEALLTELQAIEAEHERERPYPGAPRTLDLDLILVGDLRLTRPGLDLPHPRFRERRFVLEPLVELLPDVVDPVTGLRARQLLDALE